VKRILFILLLILCATFAKEILITNDGFSLRRSLSFGSDGRAHIIYFNSTNDLVYRYSDDLGQTWSNPVLLKDYPTGTSYRSVRANIWATENSTNKIIYVAYTMYDPPNQCIYFKRSFDNGVTWSSEVNIAPAYCGYSMLQSSIWANASNVYVFFSVNSSMPYLTKSTDYGTTWSTPVYTGSKGGITYQVPTWVEEDKNKIHIVQEGAHGHDDRNVYYCNSTDGGATFNCIALRDVNDVTGSDHISVWGNKVLVVYQHSNNVYYRLSIDGGATFGSDQPVTSLTAGEADSTPGTFDTSTNNTYVFYVQNTTGTWQVHVKFYNASSDSIQYVPGYSGTNISFWNEDSCPKPSLFPYNNKVYYLLSVGSSHPYKLYFAYLPEIPSIENRTVSSITNSSAVISWDTDEWANGTVYYWSSPAQQVNHTNFNLSHQFTLSNLSPQTTYHYNITSCNYKGCDTTATYSFTTLLCNPPDTDSDGDGLCDSTENTYGWNASDPNNPPNGGSGDADNDLLTNQEEQTYGTNLTNPDTDGDGFVDGEEVNIYNTSATDANSRPSIQTSTIKVAPAFDITGLIILVVGSIAVLLWLYL